MEGCHCKAIAAQRTDRQQLNQQGKNGKYPCFSLPRKCTLLILFNVTGFCKNSTLLDTSSENCKIYQMPWLPTLGETSAECDVLDLISESDQWNEPDKYNVLRYIPDKNPNQQCTMKTRNATFSGVEHFDEEAFPINDVICEISSWPCWSAQTSLLYISDSFVSTALFRLLIVREAVPYKLVECNGTCGETAFLKLTATQIQYPFSMSSRRMQDGSSITHVHLFTSSE